MLSKYRCHKEVEAEDMSKARFVMVQTGLSELPAIADEPGYKVVYSDGYVSWSPRAVFESGYKEIDHIEYLESK